MNRVAVGNAANQRAASLEVPVNLGAPSGIDDGVTPAGNKEDWRARGAGVGKPRDARGILSDMSRKPGTVWRVGLGNLSVRRIRCRHPAIRKPK